MNRRILSLFTASALLVVSALCMPSCSKEKGPESMKKVTLATSKNLWCSLALLAKSQGYFEQEGLDVNINIQDAGRYCMDAVVSKSAEFGTVVEVNVAYIGFSGNTNVTLVATVVESVDSAIIAWKSKGIQKPQDLAGKTLALSPGTTSDLFAHRFLQNNGIKHEAVEIRKLQPKAIQAAIVAREIDAASTWEPFVQNCRKAMGEDAVVFRDAVAYTGFMNVAVRREWASQNADTVRAFLRALKKADKFIHEKPVEAQTILAKEINLDIEIVRAIWTNYEFKVALDEARLGAAITSEGQWIHQTQEGFTEKAVPEYSTYLDGGYLKSAR